MNYWDRVTLFLNESNIASCPTLVLELKGWKTRGRARAKIKKTGLEEKKAGVVHNLVEGEKNRGPLDGFSRAY